MEKVEFFKRANFFPGLKATPGFWNEIEDYHFRKESLYNSLYHGFGIVPDYLESMHVQADKTKGGLITLIVGSGMAFDGLGRPLFLYEPQALVLDPKKFKLPCTIYITASYDEKMEDFYEDKENSDLQGYQRKKESCVISILNDIPDSSTYIELARIKLSNQDGNGITEIANCNNFTDPGTNALDYRFIPWAVRVKKGISSYLQNYMIDLLNFTETVCNTSYEVIQLPSFRNLQTVAMTSKMIMQTAGVFFDDIINIITPIFNMDHQVLFEIAEYERNNEKVGRIYTTKPGYEDARKAMYALGDAIKAYNNSYEEIDSILGLHKEVMNGLKHTLVEKEVSTSDIIYISYKMPHILLFEDQRFTLVDSIAMGSEESVEAHNLHFENCVQSTTNNEAFYYPDGVLVHDIVKRWIGGEMKFTLKNIIKGRKTLIIRRTDIHQGNYSVDVKYQGNSVKTLTVDGIDTKNRWRNLYFTFEEGELNEFNPELSLALDGKGRDNAGTIWIYQLL